MSLILSGTNGLSDVDGSAATPAIRGTDTNTGIFFPAADTIAFAEGGVEAMRLDSSGNMGLGVTPSAWYSTRKVLQLANGASLSSASNFAAVGLNYFYDSSDAGIYIANGYASLYSQSSGKHMWSTAASGTAGNPISFTQAMTLDASGNLGLTSGKFFAFDTAPSASNYALYGTSTQTVMNVGSGGALQFNINNSEKARFDSSGPLLIGLTSVFNGTTCPLQVANNAANQTFTIRNTNATPYGQYINFGGAAPNNTGSEFLYCSDTTAQRFTARSNGGLANYSGNNVNLSDRREKTNFAPAGDYLAKICAIPVQTFNYIDQNLEEDEGLTLGVVAQDVQAVAPELVMESNWAAKDAEPKMRLSIYQTDLQYALMKCIQEQQALIAQLQADVAALKGNA